MDAEEPSERLGCLKQLLVLPPLLLVSTISQPWQTFLSRLLPRSLSKDAVTLVVGVSLLAMAFAGWAAILRLVDHLFGTSWFAETWGTDDALPEQRAQLRRRGMLIIAAVVAADEATKFAFGVDRPALTSIESGTVAPDAMTIVLGIGVLLFLFAWWRGSGKLESTGISLMLGGLISSFLAQVFGDRAAIPFQVFGAQRYVTFGAIAGTLGFGLYIVSQFWEPGETESVDAPASD